MDALLAWVMSDDGIDWIFGMVAVAFFIAILGFAYLYRGQRW